MVKVIKTEEEYKAALAAVENLIDLDPDVGTPGADQLQLLTLLIQNYESEKYKILFPDPIEAIQFRMEQQDLSPRDLIPYLGSRSKVSEVLSKKRPLTLAMIQALHEGLGIPAAVLIQSSRYTTGPEDEAPDVDWKRFPLREMITRGWIKADISASRLQTDTLLQQFFEPIGGIPKLSAILYRKTQYVRSARRMDEYALAAWAARIMNRAMEDSSVTEYKPGTVDLAFMQTVAHLSRLEDGPMAACRFLKAHGISLIVEPHLPHTHLDGAVLLASIGKPVIGLTLRQDRIDNFWFCLMHELAHLSLHLDNTEAQFYDDLESENEENALEREADELAGEALIPAEAWRRSAASRIPSAEAALVLANKLNIHQAIVAGRIRNELRSFRILKDLVGHRQVRRQFSDVKWGKEKDE